MIIPVILAGGSGTRLWPASRQLHPKQFLALLDDELSLFQHTLKRLANLTGVAEPIIVCHEDHRFLVAEQIRSLGLKAQAIILEPCAKNTAPAIALAANINAFKDASLLVLPADQLMGNIDVFEGAVSKARQLCQTHYLVSFGINPEYPETGYGYIKRGLAFPEPGCFRIAEFVEKPALPRAQQFFDSKDYLWNSGMFCFKAQDYLNELKQHAPEIYDCCYQTCLQTEKDFDFIRVPFAQFNRCPSNSIDYAVMEKTLNAAVVSLDAKWSDVGAWDSLWKSSLRTEQNNAVKGDVILEETENSLIHAHSRLVAAIGMKNHIIVETADAVLVAEKSHSQSVKKIAELLLSQNRAEIHLHKKVYRPWGWYENICSSERFQVKRILVLPGARLSLQKHRFRAEHWVVVKGSAKITNGNDVKIYQEDQSTYIPIGNQHRLENPGKEALEIIEVQTGSYLGEDDIIRLEDNYGR